MADEQHESMPTRGENMLNGRVILDQINDNVVVYDANDKPVYKVGYLGDDGFGNPIYAAAAYDADGNLVTGTGLIGSSDVSTRIYGTIVYDILNRSIMTRRFNMS